MAFVVKIPTFLLFFITNLFPSCLSAPLFPCFFIFGDSLVDSGNNNEVNTTAKANYPPYGVDFPLGPTGRFTNGRTTADFLAEIIGFNTYIPPFATAQGCGAVNGVNYASGASGIRFETGQQLGEPISLDRQLLNHNTTISRFRKLSGNRCKANDQLKKCLYHIVVGSNDYINNYYLPEYYPTSKLYTLEQYAVALVDQYSEWLKELYNFGARKISICGLGPLGCIPAMLARGTYGSGCNELINSAVNLFNQRLKLLVQHLNNELNDAKFIYAGAMDFRLPGFGYLSSTCCTVSNTTGFCVARETPCFVRDAYYFYDDFHPTEIVNNIIASAWFVEILKLI